MAGTSRAVAAGTLLAVAVLLACGVGAVATGRLCITSAERPVDRHEGGLLVDSSTGPQADADADGVGDNEDVLTAALAYVQRRPRYKSAYYASGYPDDEFGVCTDVVAIACREAGYDLQLLVAADIACRPDAYSIEIPDPAIDFRRTSNLEVFLGTHALALTTDVNDTSQWRGGDIVLYDGHIGIVSDRRDSRGVPYLIHHSGPFQLRYEEDKLEGYGNIVGHYRLDPACLELLAQ